MADDGAKNMERQSRLGDASSTMNGSPQQSRSPSRHGSTALLASPIPSSPPVRQVPVPQAMGGDRQDRSLSVQSQTPLAGVPEEQSSLPGPRASSLSQAIRQTQGQSPPRFNTPPPNSAPPTVEQSEASSLRKDAPSGYGSFDTRRPSGVSSGRSPSKHEDIEVLRRHLVSRPGNNDSSASLPKQSEQQGGLSTPNKQPEGTSPAPGIDDDEFSSLQLQGGDITRHIYRYTEEREREQNEASARSRGMPTRSLSMHLPRTEPDDGDVSNIRKPGGLRRDYIRRNAESPAPSERQHRPSMGTGRAYTEPPRPQPKFLANNFIEFLTLYGHFAGEEFDEDDETLGPDEYFSSDPHGEEEGEDQEQDEREYGEDSALLTPGKRKRRRKQKEAGKGSPRGAALLLLKSFVGTGVLFLPRAFLNGGMLFSNLVLLVIAGLSLWCFLLLVTTRLKVHASFGDMGGQIYGTYFRNLINFSLVVSQVGFASAYIVFVSQNLQAFILAVSKCRTNIDIKYMILMQMAVFLPLSLYRNINHIQKLALVADLFIALGLIYLYYYDIYSIVANHGASDIVNFNKNDWTLFIGTAIFTFEGIGLIIPIQSGMKDPTKFPKILSNIMVIITVIFVSIGALSYAAYGSKTQTVIILNLPQDNKMVNAVQFIYSLAILLSTPLQIYPAIEITSQQLFSRTGKYNKWIKWKKNVFRFFMVVMCALIAYAGANDLDKFVALVGSFACIPLVYIYPPLMHYRVAAEKRWQKVTDIGLCVIGFVAMGYTTALTILSWSSGSSEKPVGFCDEYRRTG